MSAVLLVKIGFFAPPKKTFAQGLVAVQRGQQVRPMVIAGVMRVEAGAVVHHGAFQVFVEQPQARDQRMNRPQHGPGDIVGVDLVTAHHQQGRALGRCVGVSQQAVDAEQAFVGPVMRFAAGAVHQLVDAAVQHKARGLGVGVQKVWRPFGDAAAVDHHVVANGDVLGQRRTQPYVDQVNKGLPPNRDDMAVLRIEVDSQRLACG